MEKNKRNSLLIAMKLVAQNVYKLEQENVGICGFRTNIYWPDGNWFQYKTEPSVQMSAEGFLEMFGDDYEFEYVTDKDGDVQMQLRDDGVLFYALVN